MMSDENTYSPVIAEELISVDERVKKFSSILETIENLGDKKKELWREIYMNSITDRHNALMCYNDLMMHVLGKPMEHAVHAPNLAKYIEKMSRANDQLIRLAELIAEAESKNDQLDPEEIYKNLASG